MINEMDSEIKKHFQMIDARLESVEMSIKSRSPIVSIFMCLSGGRSENWILSQINEWNGADLILETHWLVYSM